MIHTVIQILRARRRHRRRLDRPSRASESDEPPPTARRHGSRGRPHQPRACDAGLPRALFRLARQPFLDRRATP